MKNKELKDNGKLTEAGVFGAIIGGISGCAIGIAAGAPLPALGGGALIGAAVSQWTMDIIRNRREKSKHV